LYYSSDDEFRTKRFRCDGFTQYDRKPLRQTSETNKNMIARHMYRFKSAVNKNKIEQRRRLLLSISFPFKRTPCGYYIYIYIYIYPIICNTTSVIY